MSPEMPHWRTEWLVALAFIALIPSLVGLYFVDKAHRDTDRKARAAIVLAYEKANLQLEESQRRDAWARYDDGVASCLRGNTLRQQLNANIETAQAIAFLIAQVLNDSALNQVQNGDPHRAQELRESRDKISRSALKLAPVTQPDCGTVIQKPRLSRPDSP